LGYDEGETWPVSRVLEPGIAGYSDMAMAPDGTIYCLFESADDRMSLFTRTHLVLARFNLEWLTGGADSLANMRRGAHPRIKAE
jgi:sialidase-1